MQFVPLSSSTAPSAVCVPDSIGNSKHSNLLLTHSLLTFCTTIDHSFEGPEFLTDILV